MNILMNKDISILNISNIKDILLDISNLAKHQEAWLHMDINDIKDIRDILDIRISNQGDIRFGQIKDTRDNLLTCNQTSTFNSHWSSNQVNQSEQSLD